MAKSVLFLVPYPLKVAPSQRFRVELYEPVLQEHNVRYEIASFMDDATWNIIFKPGNTFKKIAGIAKGYLRRIGHLFKATQYDYVFIHREVAPLGPPIFEWIIAKVLHKKIIYDFDDAIWISNISTANKFASWLKAFWKVKYICKWAHVVTGGNEYLNNYARQHNARQTIILPTCVDVERKHNKVKIHGNHKPVIGWTGSHSTLFYLDEIVPLLKKLQEENNFTFLVIADKKPEIDLRDWQFIKWNEATEGSDLLKMDIGIMPLKSDAWSEGKCGFKLIQYLSCGIPAIADPIGVNKVIIDNEKNGFICSTKEEWKEKLQLLITDPALRKELGEKGREKIKKEYSIQSQAQKFLALFQ
ncbi:MAG TPA: glycosyltransferase [Flavipsychrobacter sp.]|nr:glycosyltransferase [Flavipsychrobacter sp.]